MPGVDVAPPAEEVMAEPPLLVPGVALTPAEPAPEALVEGDPPVVPLGSLSDAVQAKARALADKAARTRLEPRASDVLIWESSFRVRMAQPFSAASSPP
jgi:hypothetical protein